MATTKLISDYEQLMNYIFEIELENGNKIELIFEKKFLKHLIGLHKITFLKLYSGDKIFAKLKTGKFTVIDDSNLLLQTKPYKNKSCVDKIVNFPLVKSHLFSSTGLNHQIVNFDKLKVSVNCNQGSEFLFHFESTDKLFRYHLGLSFDVDLSYYIPRSFFIESEARKDLYITNQEELIIKKITRKNRVR